MRLKRGQIDCSTDLKKEEFVVFNQVNIGNSCRCLLVLKILF